VPNVQCKTPDDGQRNCLKHVEFLDKNNFVKICRSVDFIKKIVKFTSNTAGVYREDVWDCRYYCSSALTYPGVQLHVSASMPTFS